MRFAGLHVCAVVVLCLSACPVPDDQPPPHHNTPHAADYRFNKLDVTSAGKRWGHLPIATSGPTWFIGGADIVLSTNVGVVNMDLYRVDVDGSAPLFVNVPHGDGPTPRYCGCAALDEAHNELLMVGGRDNDNAVVHDAWWLALDTGTWTQVQGEIPLGSVGCGVAFVPDGDRAYLFGGGSDSFASGATYRFDALTHTFTEIDVDGPGARFDHAMRLSTDHTFIWLVSGARTAVNDFRDDVWRFDVATETWSELAVTGDRPPGRRTPWVAVRDDDRAIVMGFGAAGLAPESDVADLWLLDVDALTWERLDVDNVDDMLAPRAFSYFLKAPAGGIGLVYGGTDMEQPLDDVRELIGPNDGHSWH